MIVDYKDFSTKRIKGKCDKLRDLKLINNFSYRNGLH